ncbi:hypothetical protein GCM10027160_45360 [Streptomyces calidiresistens]
MRPGRLAVRVIVRCLPGGCRPRRVARAGGASGAPGVRTGSPPRFREVVPAREPLPRVVTRRVRPVPGSRRSPRAGRCAGSVTPAQRVTVTDVPGDHGREVNNGREHRA